MSAGPFVVSKYATNQDVITPIRVQPETLLATAGGTANTAPVGDVTDGTFTRASGGLRLTDFRARCIFIRFPATGQPTGYKPLGVTRIPALTKVFYNACVTVGAGGPITYLGVTCTIVGGDPRESRGLTAIPDA